MGNRHSPDESDAEESTTLVHSGPSGARFKAALELTADAKVRLVEPPSHKVALNSGPASDEFVKASVALPVAAPVASSGMVGPYHLALEIASGGMATVYLAVHGLEGFQNTVAVKRIHPHLAKDKEFVDMFADEAHIAARINHPYVCRVFDFGKTADNSYYIAMEFLRGEPLSRVFKALTPERVTNPRHPTIITRIIANLAEGLHAAHILKDTQGVSLEVVHRDITPQNLFVLSDGTVRVTDFGIARARVRSHQTQGGRIKGKLSYMSPEQLNQEPVDRRSDIWGLGVVAWELLTGRRLFRAASEGETVLSVLSRPIPPPSRFADSVPRKLDDIVLRALSRNPETRYSSARDLARALEAFLATSGDTVPTMDVADWVEDLFPGAGSRSDGLVRLAHAVVPPERRSVRPPVKPSVPPSAVPAPAASTARAKSQPTPTNLRLVSTAAPSELHWGRAVLLTVALLAGVASTALLVNRWRSASVARFAPPAATSESIAERSLANSAVVSPARSAQTPVDVPPASVSASNDVPPTITSASKLVPMSTAATNSASSKAPVAAATAARRAAATVPSAAPVAMNKTGSVQLMTRNGHAEVYLGTRLLGVTPLTVDLATGTVSLLLKPIGGGEPRNVSVAIQPGATSFISVPLTAPTP